MVIMFQAIILVVLMVDSVLPFSSISSKTKSLGSRSTSPIKILHNSHTERYSALGRISLSSPLFMARQDFDGYCDEDDYENSDDDLYEEKEGKVRDESDDYYSCSSYYEEENNKKSTQKKQRRRAPSNDDYYDDYDDDLGTMRRDEDDYENEMDQGRGGYFQVSFNDEVDPSETEIDWEVCSSISGDEKTQALVLLPPAAVERPTAIIHFVGGTFFGSNPKLWYRSLLESIVRSTSAAIVVTPIPVTLFNNPLQHVRLSQKLQKSFHHAWATVLEDEYGSEAMRDIPLCGLGHSLGARLLAVLTTLNQNAPMKAEGRRRGPITPIPPYKSMCLVSFTNYGAKVGIPGLAALRKQSKKREQFNKKNNGRRSRTRYDRYDDDYEVEEWAELVEDLQETVSEQTNRIKTALTPNANDLEFVPSPDRLWKAIREDARYNVNTTLVVQFDDDPIDQSSQLAQALHSTNSSDVRFARLRGNHLTPVSVTDDNHGDSSAQSRQTRAGRLGAMIEKTVKGNNKNRSDRIAMRDLRLSIISYVTDVVTK